MAGPAATTTGDHLVTGALIAGSITYPAGSISNLHIASTAAILPSKLKSAIVERTAQVGTAITETRVLGGVRGATRTLTSVSVWNITACQLASTVTIDIQKNGVTVLSAVLTLDLNTGDNSFEVGTFVDTDGVVGDLYTAVITLSQVGTNPLASGILVQLHSDEDYA